MNRNRSQQAHVHHYVSQWYQKKFLKSGQIKFHYLDLRPETKINGGQSYQRRELLRWGPARCFCSEDLYTFNLGNWTTDEVERKFFGAIDSRGKTGVEFFANYDGFHGEVNEAFQALLEYMDAQRFRTPRGLDQLKSSIDLKSRSTTLLAMQELFRFHTTMWTEGVWEIVGARHSPTKFIVTDEPVTFFNTKVFPGSKECRYPSDVGLDKIGTRTLFPLSIDACLIITHIQLVRDPWRNPVRPRLNARAYQDTMMFMPDVQFGRELEEDEVLRINLILKKRATRYIAAAEKEWLYPETRVSTTFWSNLDGDWFLFPHLWKVPFITGIVAGFGNGRRWASDEHGRKPGHPEYSDRQLQEKEWDSHQLAQKTWARKRAGRSVAHVDDTMNSDGVGDRLMWDYLRSQGTKSSEGDPPAELVP